MTENLIRRLKNALNSQYYIMNDTWLRDCIEYYVDTHNNPKDEEILMFVKAQWQLSDLRDINNENGCLPMNLGQQKCTVLPNTYILQMDKMYDISTSKYKQLENIRNISTANIETTENEKPQSWEPKRKRMLQLHLTDGVQDVTAIEYTTMTSLNDTLLPGYKVMIIGPLVCRRGVILLEQGKFKEIGGEVENLLIPNALENVLARALNLAENPDPYNDKEESQNNQNRQEQIKNDNQQNNLFEDEFEIDLEEVSNIEIKSQETVKLEIIDKPVKAENVGVVERNGGKSEIIKHEVDEILDFDDDILEMVDESQFNVPDKNIVHKRESSTSEWRNTSEKTADLKVKAEERSSTTIMKETPLSNIRGRTMQSKQFGSNTNTKQAIKQNNMEFPDDDFDFDDFDVVPIEPKISTDPPKMTTAASKSNDNTKVNQSNMEPVNANKICAREEIPESSASSRAPSNTAANVSVKREDDVQRCQMESSFTSAAKGNKRPVTQVSPTPSSSPKVRCLQNTPKQAKGARKVSDMMEPSYVPEPAPPKICDFLCDVIKESVSDATFTTVRGKVSSFGKLSKRDLCWHVEGTITDGTASMDVEFASGILERLLGFSVHEFLQKKKLRKTQPNVEQELRLGFRNAEQKLKNLDALLELELARDKKPRVINITHLTDQQKDAFDKRLKLLLI